MKKRLIILLLVVSAGHRTLVRGELADGIRAVVHDALVTSLDVEEATLPMAEELNRQYRSQPDVYYTKMRAAEDENQDRLVQDKLILHEFATAGYNLPESIIDEYVQQRVHDRFGSRATLNKTLAAEGSNFEKFRRQIRDQFIIEQMQLANVARDVVVSPHKIETYYLAHTNDFKLAEQVKLRMIYLPKGSDDSGQTRKLADEVLAKLKEGADFGEMAGLYSQDANRKQGGVRDWDEVSKLNPLLAEAVSKINVGQISPVIEASGACYLLKLDDRQPAHTRPLAEVRAEIEKTLSGDQRNLLHQQWIERMRKKTFVRYF